GESLGGVLTQELVQLVPAELEPAYERLRDELREQSDVGAGDGRRRLAREGAAEDGELPEAALVPVRQQSPRVIEGGPETAVALRDVAHRRLEEPDRALDLVGDLRAREHGDP